MQMQAKSKKATYLVAAAALVLGSFGSFGSHAFADNSSNINNTGDHSTNTIDNTSTSSSTTTTSTTNTVTNTFVVVSGTGSIKVSDSTNVGNLSTGNNNVSLSAKTNIGKGGNSSSSTTTTSTGDPNTNTTITNTGDHSTNKVDNSFKNTTTVTNSANNTTNNSVHLALATGDVSVDHVTKAGNLSTGSNRVNISIDNEIGVTPVTPTTPTTPVTVTTTGDKGGAVDMPIVAGPATKAVLASATPTVIKAANPPAFFPSGGVDLVPMYMIALLLLVAFAESVWQYRKNRARASVVAFLLSGRSTSAALYALVGGTNNAYIKR